MRRIFLGEVPGITELAIFLGIPQPFNSSLLNRPWLCEQRLNILKNNTGVPNYSPAQSVKNQSKIALVLVLNISIKLPLMHWYTFNFWNSTLPPFPVKFESFLRTADINFFKTFLVIFSVELPPVNPK